jgi:hypothetical protein
MGLGVGVGHGSIVIGVQRKRARKVLIAERGRADVVITVFARERVRDIPFMPLNRQVYVIDIRRKRGHGKRVAAVQGPGRAAGADADGYPAALDMFVEDYLYEAASGGNVQKYADIVVHAHRHPVDRRKLGYVERLAVAPAHKLVAENIRRVAVGNAP